MRNASGLKPFRQGGENPIVERLMSPCFRQVGRLKGYRCFVIVRRLIPSPREICRIVARLSVRFSSKLWFKFGVVSDY